MKTIPLMFSILLFSSFVLSKDSSDSSDSSKSSEEHHKKKSSEEHHKKKSPKKPAESSEEKEEQDKLEERQKFLPSWKLDFTSNTEIGTEIVYEFTSKVLAFINYEKNVAVVFPGRNIVGLFNFKMNVGLLINLQSDIAKYFDKAPDCTQFFLGDSPNVFAAINAYADFIQDNTDGFIPFFIMQANAFHFKLYIQSLIKGYPAPMTTFTLKTQVNSKVSNAFYKCFSPIYKHVAGSLRFSFGILNVFDGLIANSPMVSYMYIAFIDRVIKGFSGFPDGAILYQFFRQMHLYLDQLKKGVITEVKIDDEYESMKFYAKDKMVFEIAQHGLVENYGQNNQGLY